MQKLFPSLTDEACHILEDFPAILQNVWPLQKKHRQQLPYAIEELSTRLTSERKLLQQAYWASPRLTSAYLWYFLPWNIIRLTRLLQGLDLSEPTPLAVKNSAAVKPRIFADLGSGPLSLPIALWLAKPQWRHIPLTVLCVDTAPHPLNIGQKLFENLAGNNSPWRIVTARSPLEASASHIQKLEGVPWLITAANVCNELKSRHSKGQHGHDIEQRFEEILEKLSLPLYADDSQLLIVEPGTRLGGKTILDLRQAAENYDLLPISPCTHQDACPLEESRTWCHFTFDTYGAPSWLTHLSTEAKLTKHALSLAFVLLQSAQEFKGGNSGNASEGRIISAPFQVPFLQGLARYACCDFGLALIPRAESLPSGALITLQSPTNDTNIDSKSGAYILNHLEKVASPPPNQYKKPMRQEPSRNVKEVKRPTKKPLQKAKKNEKKFWEK